MGIRTFTKNSSNSADGCSTLIAGSLHFPFFLFLFAAKKLKEWMVKGFRYWRVFFYEHARPLLLVSERKFDFDVGHVSYKPIRQGYY